MNNPAIARPRQFQFLMSMRLQDGKPQMIEATGKETSRYSYEKLNIDQPEDPKKYLLAR
jgi:hypothetical protein